MRKKKCEETKKTETRSEHSEPLLLAHLKLSVLGAGNKDDLLFKTSSFSCSAAHWSTLYVKQILEIEDEKRLETPSGGATVKRG